MKSGTKHILQLQSLEFAINGFAGREKSREEKLEAIEKYRRKVSIQDLRRYDSRKRKFGSESIVPLQGNLCSGCRVTVSRATQRLAQAGSIAECEHCGRLLYEPSRRHKPLKMSMNPLMAAYLDDSEEPEAY